MHEEDNPVKYVSGFLLGYDPAGAVVVLLLKKKHGPPHMLGQWTAPGGKVEETDGSLEDATSREFQEETALAIPPSKWLAFGKIRRRTGHVALFAAWHSPDDRAQARPFHGARALTAEPLRIWRMTDLRELPSTSNVPFLVHAAHYALARQAENLPPAMLALSIEGA
jgi:ADP-ribose pyrophosphatase YjhB (NUDIX family)